MLLNRERALELMQRFSVDALLGATRENVIYMSDFAPWGQAVHKYFQRPNFVVFCRQPDQTPALLMYPGEATYFAAQKPWLQEVYTYGGGRALRYPTDAPPSEEEERFVSVFDKAKLLGKSPAEALTRLLRDKGLNGRTVAWDDQGMVDVASGPNKPVVHSRDHLARPASIGTVPPGTVRRTSATLAAEVVRRWWPAPCVLAAVGLTSRPTP